MPHRTLLLTCLVSSLVACANSTPQASLEKTMAACLQEQRRITREQNAYAKDLELSNVDLAELPPPDPTPSIQTTDTVFHDCMRNWQGEPKQSSKR